MTFNKRFLRQPCLAAGILLLVLNGFATSAKTSRAPVSKATSSSSEPIFNLSDFNAVGDGVADDGPALQRALDALADAGGGTLFIPAGHYLVETPVIKDFSSLNGGKIKIQGVPSLTMPAPPHANGQDLAAGLDLTSEIIPATGEHNDAIRITNLNDLLIEHVAFVGQSSAMTDAYITLYLSDIDKITIRHTEFYAVSTFGLRAGFGGGNIVRAVRSDMSIESIVFLGCTANSGAYAPIIENIEWRGFSIANSIFLDYGLRPLFGKMGLGAPLSWINIANAAATTPDSPRREIVIRDIFLDEGGWVGLSAFPRNWGPATAPIDLIYISGLKMNVSNLGTAGHLFYDVRNLLIENSHYGWSHNTIAAIDINRFEHAILDRLTCIEDADRIRADDRTERLTVINSDFGGLDSHAQITTVMDTAPEYDPVQYVRQQFATVLGRQPDPAAHFYWSDMLIKCGSDNDCLNQKRSALSEYLNGQPEPEFSLTGTVTDENGDAVSGATISLTGSQTFSTVTDSQGNFRFAGLPTSGSYTVAAEKRHHNFASNSQTVIHPAGDVAVEFQARLNRYSLGGRITKVDGTAVSGVTMQLAQTPAITATTDANGFYSFTELAAGESYTVVPLSADLVFDPVNKTFTDLSADRAANFVGKLQPQLLLIESSELAVALDSVSFMAQPFSLFNSLGFSTDGFMRVMIFAKNVEPVSTSQLLVVAADDAGQTYPLEVEFIGEVPGQSWLKQLNLKISPAKLGGKCVQLQLSIADVKSNNGRICIGSVSSSSSHAR